MTNDHNQLHIRVAEASDLDVVQSIHRAAFGSDVEADLVAKMLGDPTAVPVLSLLAVMDGQPVGHILFSRVRLQGGETGCPMSILAPLAVLPDYQRQGIGGNLIEAGLKQLAENGVDLVFVLGDPKNYGRHGFEPATRHGLIAPHAIPAEYADAWMVQALKAGVLGSVQGTVLCSDVLNRPEYWRG